MGKNMAGFTKPPVTYRNTGYTSRYNKSLAYAIATTAIATEKRAVAARMGIGRINDLIATR